MRFPWGPKAGFRWAALVKQVTDGDTLRTDINLGPATPSKDLGFHISVDAHGHVHLTLGCRVLGENAAEHGTPAGDAATAWLRQLLPPGSPITIATQPVADDKFGGRFDANVSLPSGDDLASATIAAGHAKPWDGKGPRPTRLAPGEAP